MLTRKEAQVEAAEYQKVLKEKRKKVMASIEKEIEDIRVAGEIANELPPGFCFTEIYVSAYFCPTVHVQVEKLEEALELTKLFDLCPVAFVKSGCTELLPKAEAERKVQKDSYKTMEEISPIWAKIEGYSRETEEVHVLFHTQLKSHLVRFDILLMDDKRIHRTYQTERDYCCRYIIKNCMWHDDTKTFIRGTRFYATETSLNPFKLWNPLKA